MDVGLIIALVATVVNLTLGVFVLLQDKTSKMGKMFLLTILVACAWIISASISESPSFGFMINNIANSMAFATGYLVVVCAMSFTYIFPVIKKPTKTTIGLIVSASILSVALSLTPFVAGRADQVDNGVVEFTVGSLVWVYVVLFLLPLIVLAHNLFSRMRTGIPVRQRQQAKLVLVAFLGTSTIGIILNLIIPTVTGSWWSSQFGPLAIIFMSVILVYAMVRHRLFDIRRAAIRTFSYILSLVTLGIVYYIIAYVVSNIILRVSPDDIPSVTSPLNIALAILLAFIFQPIKRLFDRFTNLLFYRDVYSIEDFFARLTKKLSSMTNLNVLLRYSSSEIMDTLKASFGAFYIHQSDKPSVYIATDKSKKLPKDDADMLDTHVLLTKKEIIITDQLVHVGESDLKNMLSSHRIALVLPIRKDEIITGYLFLGEHLSSQYTTTDIRALLTIADELTIAIQNALSVQEVRTLNDSLQQRIDEATKELRASNAQLQRLDKAKDEFVSVASHQLRTPLTSVKGYISMVMEGDAGKITDTQKHLLGEAFTSSERMVHLINDFLNVSRLQTGKFLIDKHPVDLSKVVEQELDSLMTNATARKLSFHYKRPKDFPLLNIDEGKIRQVIMNFADNALYYSHENTKIFVSLAIEKDSVELTVKDTGIGVPRAEQSQLFSKFYRASNARKQRPDGTGVGLFLAKKVIDAHGGQVVFASTEGKGSTFGFSLPLEQLRVRSETDNLKD